MKILLSIKPEYAEKILNGEKHFEFRKKLPKNIAITKVVIYATKPIGKIIGEFEINRFLSTTPNELWKLTKDHSGIAKKFFDQYF